MGSNVFSHWPAWREELRKAIATYGEARFEADFLPRTCSAKGWTTSLVYGEPRTFGRLPHPQASGGNWRGAVKTESLRSYLWIRKTSFLLPWLRLPVEVATSAMSQ